MACLERCVARLLGRVRDRYVRGGDGGEGLRVDEEVRKAVNLLMLDGSERVNSDILDSEEALQDEEERIGFAMAMLESRMAKVRLRRRLRQSKEKLQKSETKPTPTQTKKQKRIPSAAKATPARTTAEIEQDILQQIKNAEPKEKALIESRRNYLKENGIDTRGAEAWKDPALLLQNLTAMKTIEEKETRKKLGMFLLRKKEFSRNILGARQVVEVAKEKPANQTPVRAEKETEPRGVGGDLNHEKVFKCLFQQLQEKEKQSGAIQDLGPVFPEKDLNYSTS
ncbi:hypothetical protein AAMO2058_001412400 [Amorphochlora amoebiformis]